MTTSDGTSTQDWGVVHALAVEIVTPGVRWLEETTI
jgi:hypothetical protein